MHGVNRLAMEVIYGQLCREMQIGESEGRDDRPGWRLLESLTEPDCAGIFPAEVYQAADWITGLIQGVTRSLLSKEQLARLNSLDIRGMAAVVAATAIEFADRLDYAVNSGVEQGFKWVDRT